MDGEGIEIGASHAAQKAQELEVAEPFVNGELAAALCPACTDRQFLDSDGAILELRQEWEGARFPLGKVMRTTRQFLRTAGALSSGAVRTRRRSVVTLSMAER